MGKGSGSSGTNTTVSSNSPPPQVMQAYSNVVNQAQNVASQPLNQYSGNLVAGFTPAQNQAFNTVNNSQGISTPYINAAAQYASAAGAPVTPSALGPDQISQYENPYVQQVVNATQAQYANQNAQQAAQLQGQAISAGAFGGDRAGIAQAELANQQQLAQAPTLANLYSQAYSTGLGTALQEQQTGLGAQEASGWLAANAGYGLGNLGQEAQSTALGGASAQLQSGGLQQQLAQEQLNIPYEQYQQAQAYPFQTTNFLAGIAEGAGAGMGGTSSTTSPGPSTIGQIAGLGLTGLGLYGAANNAGLFNSGSSAGTDAAAYAASMAAPAGYASFADAAAAGAIPMRRGGPIGFAGGGPMGGGGAPIGIPLGVPDVSLSFVPPPGTGGGGIGRSLMQPTGGTSTTTPSGGGNGFIQQALPYITTAAEIAALFRRGGGVRGFATGGAPTTGGVLQQPLSDPGGTGAGTSPIGTLAGFTLSPGRNIPIPVLSTPNGSETSIPGFQASPSPTTSLSQAPTSNYAPPSVGTAPITQLTYPSQFSGPPTVGAPTTLGALATAPAATPAASTTPTTPPPLNSFGGWAGDSPGDVSLAQSPANFGGYNPSMGTWDPTKMSAASFLNSIGYTGAARGGRLYRDDGGGVSTGAAAAGVPGALGGDPISQGMLRQFGALPVEKLQELSVRVPPQTPQGQMIRRVLQMKRMQPQQGQANGMPPGPFGSFAQLPQGFASAPAAGVAPSVGVTPTMAGGGALHRDDGGQLYLPPGAGDRSWASDLGGQFGNWLQSGPPQSQDVFQPERPTGAYMLPPRNPAAMVPDMAVNAASRAGAAAGAPRQHLPQSQDVFIPDQSDALGPSSLSSYPQSQDVFPGEREAGLPFSQDVFPAASAATEAAETAGDAAEASGSLSAPGYGTSFAGAEEAPPTQNRKPTRGARTQGASSLGAGPPPPPPVPAEEPQQGAQGATGASSLAAGPTATEPTVAPQRATREQGTGDKLANSPWLPVLTAGLGTLASRSPFASVAIGQGGLEGVKTLQQQQGAQREQDKLETDKEYREAEVKNRADQLSQLAKQHTETIGQEQKRLAAEQENWQKQRKLQGAQIAETGKYREALEVPPDVRSATWYAGATPEQRAAYDKMYSARRAPMAGVAGAVRWIENDPAFAGKDPMAVYQQMRQTNNPQARAQLKERYMTSQGNVQRGLSPQELGQEFETLFPAGVPAAGAAAPAGGGSKPPVGDILGN